MRSSCLTVSPGVRTLLFLVSWLFGFRLLAQSPEWKEFFALPDQISTMADAGDYLWMYRFSVYKFHKPTGTLQRYTKLPAELQNRLLSCMTVDSQGELWVGADNSIGKFDGTRWTAYDLPTQYSAMITCIHSGTRANEVWVGTSRLGVWRFNNGTWTHYNSQNSGLPDDEVRDILLDGQGRVWVATRSGVALYDGSNWTVFTSQNAGLPSNYCRDLDLDNQGRLWVFTYDGLARYDGSSWVSYVFSRTPGFPAGFFPSRMEAAPNGRIWLAGEGSAFLVSFDGNSFQVFNRQNTGVPLTAITCLVVDAQGRLWMTGEDRQNPPPGEYYKGLIRYDGTTWTIFRDTYNGLPLDYYINHIASDSSNRIWMSLNYGVGAYGVDPYHSLVLFDRSNWRIYTPRNSGLPNAFINGFVIDRQGRLWIATYGAGLVRFDGTNWTSIRASASTFPNDTLTAIHLDAQNRLWVGSIRGLSQYDGSRWTHYNVLNSGLPDNNVWAIGSDAQGRLWVGTERGVACLNGTNWTTYTSSNSPLPQNEVWLICSDRQGGVWMATGGGLVRTNGTNWQIYNTLNSPLPDNEVSAMAVDASGNLWVGFDMHGVARFDGSNWTFYNESNSGLPYNYVSAIAVDLTNHKWIATEGLAVFREGGVSISSLPRSERPLKKSEIYPNPAHEQVMAHLHTETPVSASIRIIDSEGRVQVVQNLGELPAGEHWIPLSLPNLSNGYYILQVMTPYQVQSFPLIIARP